MEVDIENDDVSNGVERAIEDSFKKTHHVVKHIQMSLLVPFLLCNTDNKDPALVVATSVCEVRQVFYRIGTHVMS